MHVPIACYAVQCTATHAACARQTHPSTSTTKTDASRQHLHPKPMLIFDLLSTVFAIRCLKHLHNLLSMPQAHQVTNGTLQFTQGCTWLLSRPSQHSQKMAGKSPAPAKAAATADSKPTHDSFTAKGGGGALATSAYRPGITKLSWLL